MWIQRENFSDFSRQIISSIARDWWRLHQVEFADEKFGNTDSIRIPLAFLKIENPHELRFYYVKSQHRPHVQ